MRALFRTKRRYRFISFSLPCKMRLSGRTPHPAT